MATRLWYWGAAGYEILGPTHRIVVDPFLSENPAAPVQPEELETPDVILVSHAAFDHYGDTAAIAARTGAPVLCYAAVRAMLLDEGIPSEQVQAHPEAALAARSCLRPALPSERQGGLPAGQTHAPPGRCRGSRRVGSQPCPPPA